ncbi:unnamed protein product [Tetraodon nigroviridis]|uniref:Chromosome 2 SCAF14738, whole genome shotgun sequence n=1 Tax=Tetraodon nigroviridis TaxID=99883 RepID=Q4S4F0_TETNG|nr:unnamed protein product [Tetraodon nigroviridis]
MDDLDDRNRSLQRKKPPWLELDIPVIQLTPDETPTLKQVKKKLQTELLTGGVISLIYWNSIAWSCAKK